MPDASPAIRISAEDASKAWAPDLLALAAAARAAAESRLGLTLEEAPLVEVHTPESAFYSRLGRKPHNVIAVAFAHDNRIVINLQRYIEGGVRGSRNTLIHEFTHLILGQSIPAGLPRWMDEGLAMIVSGETSLGYPTRVGIAATFGTLIPLEELDDARFGTRDQELAYAQSLSATKFFLDQQGGGDPNDPKPLVQKLAHPEEGQHLRALLHDSNFIRAFDRQWRDSVSSLWTTIAAITSGGILWGFLALLFLVAYWRKRRMSRAREREWEEEEEPIPPPE
jgi:hypothetical protein